MLAISVLRVAPVLSLPFPGTTASRSADEVLKSITVCKQWTSGFSPYSLP
jgi:hypothetical protein